MDKKELAQRLMGTFLEELQEHVEAMNRELLTLEKKLSTEQRTEALRVLFRSAHTMKGASRAVGAEVIEHSCHIMEDILSEVRDGKRELEPACFALFFKVADAIEEAGMRLREEQDLVDSPLQALIPELQSLAEPDEPATEVIRASVQPDSDRVTAGNRPDNIGTESGAQPTTDQRAANELLVSMDGATADSTRPNPALSGGSIRIAAEKLDTLLAQNGELLVARRRVEQRSADAEELSEAILSLRTEWNKLAKPLEKILNDGSGLVGDRHRLPDLAALRSSSERLTQLEKDCDRLKVNMAHDARVLGQTCDALDGEVYRVRMIPFAEACGGLKRAVRDVSQATGKEAELRIEGDDVEVDRSVLEGLKDPLLHLVRNAVDHGIERPAERKAAGKPERGQLTVSAALRGGQVEVVVDDDGRGFDLQRIRQKAEQRGLSIPQEESEQARIAFLPGLSTAELVTNLSGRGVGLDVVKSAVQQLHGSIGVDHQESVGSRFTITVPLTLTTVRCVLANAAGHTYAIPTSSVRQIHRFDTTEVHRIAGRDSLLLGGTPTPLAGLCDVLRLGGVVSRSAESDKLLAIVVGTSDQRVALVVDEVMTEQEVLVKNLGTRIRCVRHVAGATMLPSGRVALVLNTNNVVTTALSLDNHSDFAQVEAKETEQKQRRLLVVDDSITTRALMKGILESAGFQVTSVVDGLQAWQLLETVDVDAVVSDIDMPRMNGFELTDRIRKSSKLKDLPVVLVTARATDEDKTHGVQVGANAYIVKSGFDQSTLLEVIEQFV